MAGGFFPLWGLLFGARTRKWEVLKGGESWPEKKKGEGKCDDDWVIIYRQHGKLMSKLHSATILWQDGQDLRRWRWNFSVLQTPQELFSSGEIKSSWCSFVDTTGWLGQRRRIFMMEILTNFLLSFCQEFSQLCTKNSFEFLKDNSFQIHIWSFVEEFSMWNEWLRIFQKLNEYANNGQSN